MPNLQSPEQFKNYIKEIEDLKKAPAKNTLKIATKCFIYADSLKSLSIADFKKVFPEDDKSPQAARTLSFYVCAAFYACTWSANHPQEYSRTIDDLLDQSLLHIENLITKHNAIFAKLSEDTQLKLWTLMHNTHLNMDKYKDQSPKLTELLNELNKHEPFKGLYKKLPARPVKETKSGWTTGWGPTLFTTGIGVALLTSSPVLGYGVAAIGLSDMLADAWAGDSDAPKRHKAKV